MLELFYYPGNTQLNALISCVTATISCLLLSRPLAIVKIVDFKYLGGLFMKKEENKKKPIYKRIWFWLVVLILVGADSSTFGQNTSNSTSSSNASSSSKSSSNGNLVSLTNFNKINLSSSNGDSKETIRKLFGKKEASTSSSTVENIKTELLTWDSVDNGSFASNITINFDNDHAVVKSISGLKVNRSKKLSLSDFEAISDGQSQDDVKKKLGEPNGYTITDLAGYKSEVWEYTSGIKGSVGANFNITFTDGKVSGKSQYEMK